MEGEFEKVNSEIGIVSFAISIFEIIIWIGYSLDLSIYDRFSSEQYLILFVGVPIGALILGIVGLIQKKRKKNIPNFRNCIFQPGINRLCLSLCYSIYVYVDKYKIDSLKYLIKMCCQEYCLFLIDPDFDYA
jgi:LPXTG-motif cell wall-anchored protein